MTLPKKRQSSWAEHQPSADILGPCSLSRCIDSGQRIGRYQLIRRLAVGGMAEIFLARRPASASRASRSSSCSSASCRSTRRSGVAAHVPRRGAAGGDAEAPEHREVYDIGADDDAPFFAMEYVHGENVREMLRAQGRAADLSNVRASAPLPLAHA